MARIWNKHKQSNTPLKRKVFVAMSGGVDSSVAALLLKNQGYDVAGVFMRCYNLDGCAEKDAEDARRVAEHLQIPFYVWDFEEEYKRRVVDYMIEGYKQGITPNPDVMCNREIKFGLFFDRALAAGADYVATGHYVRLERDLKIENYKLKIARDTNKDQSYFLWTLTQDKLRHCFFPIGDYLKSEVREMACQAGLPTAEKKDSQGICFLGKITLADFLKESIPERRGALLSTSGQKIGEHCGAEFYTIGQRHLGVGCQVPGIKGRHETKPVYVAEKNVATNTIVVAEGRYNPALYRKEVELTDVNLISALPLAICDLPVMARVRYRQPLAPATLMYVDKGLMNADLTSHPHKSASLSANIRVVFEEPQKFIAPGQSAVFYSDAGEMLGGGVIV